MENKSFFDNSGIIRLYPEGDHPVENTPLFHATYLIGTEQYEEENLDQITSFIDSNGDVGKNLANGRSHDNMTAVLVYLSLFVEKNHQSNPDLAKEADYFLELLNTSQYKHPRDLLFFAKHKNIFSYLLINTAVLFLVVKKSLMWFLVFPDFILFVIYFYMAIRKYKVRNGLKIFKTDTEILYGLRLLIESPILVFIYRFTINPLLKLKYGKYWMRNALNIYYKEESHPNRQLIFYSYRKEYR